MKPFVGNKVTHQGNGQGTIKEVMESLAIVEFKEHVLSLPLSELKVYQTLTDAQLRELIEDLRGSCMDEEEALRKVTGVPENILWSDLNQGDFLDIDQQIFRCAVCGWWCGRDEESEMERDDGESVCEDCGEEQDCLNC